MFCSEICFALIKVTNTMHIVTVMLLIKAVLVALLEAAEIIFLISQNTLALHTNYLPMCNI